MSHTVYARLAAVLVLLLLGPVAARSTAQEMVTQGHAVGAVGRYSNDQADGLLAGGAVGVELRVARFIGLGGEVSVLGGGGDLLYPVSVGGALHFDVGDQPRRLSPFLGGGYTYIGALTDDGGSRGGWYVKGGIDFWRSPRKALLVEFIEIVRPGDLHTRYSLGRVGLTFQ